MFVITVLVFSLRLHSCSIFKGLPTYQSPIPKSIDIIAVGLLNILSLFNFSTREKAGGVRVEPLPPSGRATRAPVPMGLQEKPTDVEGPRGRHQAGPAAQAPTPPSQFATQSPLPRRWGDRAVGGRVQNAMREKAIAERRVHPPLPAPKPTGGTGTPGPRRPHPTQPFQAFFTVPARRSPKLLTGGLTAPHRTAPPLTPLTARHRPHPSLETRALAARHRPHWSPRPVPRVTYATFP